MRCVQLALIIALVCISQSASAQKELFFEEPRKTFEGGLAFGMNMSQVEGDSYSGYHKVGLNTGALVYIHFNQTAGISLELLYAQKGTRGAHVIESQYVGTSFDKYYLNLNYVELPVLFHWRPKLIYDIELGLSYARLMGYKEWAEADQPIIFPPDLTYFNKNDIDYVGGLSVWFHKHWHAEARAQFSAITIRPWDRVLPRYLGGNQFNNTVALRLMYIL